MPSAMSSWRCRTARGLCMPPSWRFSSTVRSRKILSSSGTSTSPSRARRSGARRVRSASPSRIVPAMTCPASRRRSGDAAQGRGLARAVGAEQHDGLAPTDAQAQARDRHPAVAVRDGQVVDDEALALPGCLLPRALAAGSWRVLQHLLAGGRAAAVAQPGSRRRRGAGTGRAGSPARTTICWTNGRSVCQVADDPPPPILDSQYGMSVTMNAPMTEPQTDPRPPMRIIAM